MLVNNLKFIYDKNQDKNLLYLRNLLKEQLQYYILNFIYNSQYQEKFLFTGGTCLRFCFDLPRLSEDLDFDLENYQQFNRLSFINDLKQYFQGKLKYQDLEIKISGKNKIIYLKFPLLKKIGFPITKPSENNLFIRLDLAPIAGKNYTKEISLKSTYDLSFIIRRYSLSDIYGGKLAAILKREKWQGKEKQPRFKGRDYFDVFWLESKNIPINLNYFKSVININDNNLIIKKLSERFKELLKRKNEIKADLIPFFAESEFVNNFIDNLDVFVDGYLRKINNILRNFSL